MNLIERLECPFCKNNEFKTLYKIKHCDEKLKKFISEYYKSNFLSKILENCIYEICECFNCGGLFQKYEPDEKLSDFLYDKIISLENSFEKKNNYLEKNRNKLKQDLLMITSMPFKNKDSIKILEFGSGWGSWSKFMKSQSLNITTCEFSDSRHKHLLKNNINNIKNIDEIKDKFDFIYSEEVLEHISSPLNILNKLSKLLKTNGYMFHRFPSSYNFKKKLNTKYIPGKDCAHPLEHLNIFNKKSFLKMCEINNLQLCNSLKFKNQSLFSKIKIIKNDFLFNNILLENKNYI